MNSSLWGTVGEGGEDGVCLPHPLQAQSSRRDKFCRSDVWEPASLVSARVGKDPDKPQQGLIEEALGLEVPSSVPLPPAVVPGLPTGHLGSPT